MKPSRFVLGLLASVMLIVGLFRLHFNVEVLDLLPADEPVVLGLKLYQRHFSNARELIVTIKADAPDKCEQTASSIAQALRARKDLAASVVWEPAWMENPRDAAELVASLWFNQPPEIFGELTNRLTGPQVSALLEDARDQLATSMSPLDMARRGYDPFNLLQLPDSVSRGTAAGFGDGQSLFASADGRFRMLFVRAAVPLGNYRACRRWLTEVKRIVEQRRPKYAPEDVTVAYTGAPAFVTEIAGGMEFDTSLSVGLTSLIIGALFWLAHRRWKPVVWLLVLLALILACTLALGGLVFGAVNVVSLGFAAILLGLAVDYAVVHYQEAIASPRASIPEIRRAIGPSIFWAAATTVSAFLVLNLGGLPGLAQLGTLVAIGVTVSALVMIYAFLPPLFRDRVRGPDSALCNRQNPSELGLAAPTALTWGVRRRVWTTTLAILLVVAAVLSRGLPRIDHTADALRSRDSAAHAALEDIKARLTQGRDPLWIVARGPSEIDLEVRLDHVARLLDRAVTNGLLSGFTLPNVLWPRTEAQARNRHAAAELAAQGGALREAALSHGFSSNALALTESILATWEVAANQPGVFWPTNQMSRWILEKVVARSGAELYAVGLLYRNLQDEPDPKALEGLRQQLDQEGFILSGWELLGPAVLARVQTRLWWMVIPMVILVGLTVFLAFGRPREILLSLAVLGLSGGCLLATMQLAGWSWNLINLMALPLMLGTGVDYSIFTLLALRRHHGDLDASYRSVGRALLLCGGTAVTGFGSLALSSNAGMASLGQVCALGIAFNMLLSVYLLPVWWRLLGPEPPDQGPRSSGAAKLAYWARTR